MNVILRRDACVCMYVWAFAARVTTCSPQQVRRGFPPWPLRQGERRGGKTIGGGTTGRDWMTERSGNASLCFFVLTRPRNLCQPGNNTNTPATGVPTGVPFRLAACSFGNDRPRALFLKKERYSFLDTEKHERQVIKYTRTRRKKLHCINLTMRASQMCLGWRKRNFWFLWIKFGYLSGGQVYVNLAATSLIDLQSLHPIWHSYLSHRRMK